MPLRSKKRSYNILESEDLFSEPNPSPKKKSVETKVSKKTTQNGSLFSKLLLKAGFVLNSGDEPNMLECDQAVFRKKISKLLIIESACGTNEDFTKQFIKGLEDHIEDLNRFKWALLYTQSNSDCDSVRSSQQDSLIRLLLNFDDLQSSIIHLLIEKLLVLAYSEETNINKTSIPNLILANLRWLDHITDSEVLTSYISDLLVGAPLKLQIDAISYVSDILDDSGHSKIADVMLELYDTTAELTTPILDALPYLTLPPEKLEGIHHSVLKSIETTRPENLPVAVKFLLHNIQRSTAVTVLKDLRELIVLPEKNTSLQKSQQTQNDIDTLLFSNIKWAILSQKFLVVPWLKAIDEETDWKKITTFDLLVLFVLYECFPSRKRAIESILRNKIRLGLQPDALLKAIFINHSALLNEYFDSVQKIAGVLARGIEPAFRNFGFLTYKYCFVYLKFSQPDTVFTLISLLKENEVIREESLTLISELSFEHSSDMVQYVRLFQTPMDVIFSMNLREAKKLMNSIIYLAYNASSRASLQDELSIMVQKQLLHQDIKFKRLGVSCAVLTIKNIFSVEKSNSGSRDPWVNHLKEAESIFELVHSSAQKYPECTALFMDELASSILRDGLPAELEKWISEKVIADFEESFVIDCDEKCDVSTLPISPQWSLDSMQPDSEDPEAKSIAIKLTELALDDSGKKSIVTLGPHIRLLRMVECQLHDGNLENIDALLGCSVYAPDMTVYNKFSSLSDKEKTDALTCLFYVINWFREIINAFATQKDKDLRQKVFQRLRLMIELQKTLCSVLPHHPTFQPPPAVFDLDMNVSVSSLMNKASGGKKPKKSNGSKSSKGKKRKIDAEEIAPSLAQTQPSQITQSGINKTNSENTINQQTLRPFFRELHLDVFNLLYRQLKLDDESEESGFLTLPEAEFLVADLNSKLYHVLKSTKKVSFLSKSVDKDIGFAHLNLFAAKEVAKQTYRFVKPICVHLETISKFFQDIYTENDGLEDGPNMFTEKTGPIVELQAMLFTTLKYFLSISEIQSNEDETLKEILKIIAKNLEGKAVSSMSIDELLSSSFRYFSNFKGTICTVSGAVGLIQIMECLLDIDSNLPKTIIYGLVDDFLKKEWKTACGDREKGATYNQHVSFLLFALFKYSSNPVELAYELTVHGLQSLGVQPHPDEDIECPYATLDKSTMGVYYKCIMENLVKGLDSSLRHAEDNSKKLEIWHFAIKSFAVLVTTLKTFSTNVLLSNCLKHSKGFLEQFLRVGMPLFDKCFKSEQDDVIALIKNLQASTRFIQHVCTHVKVKQDVTLMRFVPSVKKSLEAIIYRVKAMLVANQCTDAFWLGNLKNRDLQGEEILSQECPDEEESNGGKDEESDVELEDDDKSETKESATDYSESY